MQKFLLISIIVLTVVAPAIAARDRNHRRALKKMLAWTVVGVVVYVLCLLWFYPRLL